MSTLKMPTPYYDDDGLYCKRNQITAVTARFPGPVMLEVDDIQYQTLSQLCWLQS